MTSEPKGGKTPNQSESVEWYAEGQERVVEVGEVQVKIRFVTRKGRRGRISVVAPAGARFRGGEGNGE